MFVLFALLSGCFWIPSPDHDKLIQSFAGDSGGDTDTDTGCTSTTWYRDGDDDGYGNVEDTTRACEQPAGYALYSTDCNDSDGTIHPGADEVCDDVDQDCDREVDEDALDAPTWYTDADEDGEGALSTATALCVQPSGTVDNGADCNDDAVAINTSAVEVCDDIDNDCDGLTDDEDTVDPVVDTSTGLLFYEDADGDSFGDLASTRWACALPEGYSEDSTDCDDTTADVSPACTEVCNGFDDDCDMLVDDDDDDTDGTTMTAWFPDADSDGYGDSATSGVLACDAATALPVTNDEDCDDRDNAVHPGTLELCDAKDVDEDCNDLADDDDSGVSSATQSTWYADSDSDGYGSDTAASAQLCDPSSTYPAASAGDCDDSNGAVSPGATEVCDTFDNDCDTLVDDDDDTLDTTSLPVWYVDADRDSLGDDATATPACEAPLAYVAVSGDCNDYDALVTDTEYLVSYLAGSGAVTDYTADFGAGTASDPFNFTFAENSGELRVCPGYWYATVDAVNYAYWTIQGYGNREDVILDAAGSGSVISCGNCVGTIAGLTVTGGYAVQGGGVNINNGGDLVIHDMVITANTATYDGGGLGGNIGGPSFTVTDSVISDNSGSSIGGGIGTLGGVVNVTDTDFSDNTASAGGAIGEGYGGASITVTGGTFSGNTASYGGAIFMYAGSVTATDTTFTDNSAGYGGAVAGNLDGSSDGNITLDGVTMNDNTSTSYGGAIYDARGTVTLTDCALYDNSARYGGAVALQPASGSSVSGICTGSTTTAAGIWGNLASSKGGGLYLEGGATFTSDICDWDGTVSNYAADVQTYTGTTDMSYNYADDATFSCSGEAGCF